MIHVTDWLSTFVHLAGGKVEDGRDGINQWEALIGKENPPRKEFVYNIDDEEEIRAGIR